MGPLFFLADRCQNSKFSAAEKIWPKYLSQSRRLLRGLGLIWASLRTTRFEMVAENISHSVYRFYERSLHQIGFIADYAFAQNHNHGRILRFIRVDDSKPLNIHGAIWYSSS